MLLQQTVAAISTPPGQGGIAVIRLSGQQAFAIADKVFKAKNIGKKIMQAKGYSAIFGSFFLNEVFIDEGIALCFKTPHSYTGEDVVELSCHGGELAAARLLQACLANGAAPAPAGEFTKRAVLNGRLTLTQAEAVMDIISANSKQALALAQAGLSGALYKKINAHRQKLLTLAGHLAAYTDYPEEDVEALSSQHFLAVVQAVEKDLQALLKEYEKGLILRRGISAAIVGSPNVGKSTLFNLLAGYARAIVTPLAGTTRDVVKEQLQLGGIFLNIADTAGLHETQDVIEAEGIRRSYEEIEKAALLLVVFNGAEELGPQDLALAEIAKNKTALAIVNKKDLPSKLKLSLIKNNFTKIVEISATNFEARETINTAILQMLDLEKFNFSAASIANERQLAAVGSAQQALANAAHTLQQGFTMDAAGVYLEDALAALASLTGESPSQQIFNEVFSKFCVGK